MGIFKNNQDAFGHLLFDRSETGNGDSRLPGILERYDGFITDAGSTAVYFSEYKNWPLIERKAKRLARGRILDVGCGAGRHCLYLQNKGFEVIGIDNSPLAIEVCRQRGVKNAIVLPLGDITPGLGTFDSVLMLGHNFGLFGSYKGTRRILKKLDRITSGQARIIATTKDVYQSEEPDHLRYLEYNRNQGRMSGQLKIRVRYKKYTTPWFDYLLVSRDEMERIVDGTGWKVSRYIDAGDSHYAAIIEKQKGRRKK
ncbi:MAG: methyltransferase domain-containing protein [Dehalococcoidales bacterium]|nr:MAG: methyltransferase domain-containing protein [Dehalococcoidales bacterium]